MSEKFDIQSGQYQFPYHYIVDLENARFTRTLDWGMDYYSYMKHAIELVKKYADDEVLDIGCGDGFLLNHLMLDEEVNPKVKAVGIDVDEKPIKFAQAFAHGLPNLEFKLQDIQTHEQQSKLISVIETFEHIPDDFLPTFISHIDRLLKKDGILIISVPSTAFPLVEKHYRHYTLKMLQDYFPKYTLREQYFMVYKTNISYGFIKFLLTNQRINLNFGLTKKILFWLHNRFFNFVKEGQGSHIQVVLQKKVGLPK